MDASWLPRYFGNGGCPANGNRSNGHPKPTGRTMPKDALTLLLAAPRGFCAGVDRAIQIVERALERYGAPVYVRHEIVHNRHVVEELERKGAIFVEELDGDPGGSARWCSPPTACPSRCRRMPSGASCSISTPPARWSARCIARPSVHFAAGRHIILIGHAGHPGGDRHHRAAAAGRRDAGRDVGRCRGRSTLPEPTSLAYITQTTLSVDDTDRHHRRAAPALSQDRTGRARKTSATPPPTARRRSR